MTTLLVLGVFMIPTDGEAYDPVSQPCGYLTGYTPYVNFAPDSGRVDFDYGDWSADVSVPGWGTYYNPLAAGGSAISAADKLCFDPDGSVYGDNRYAWNSNVGWIDFGWCDVAGNSPAGCAAFAPTIDFALSGPLLNPSINVAYWYGYAWNDNIGWIQLDWSCGGCDMVNNRVFTRLVEPWPSSDTTLVKHTDGYAWNDNIGWIRMGAGAGSPPATYQQIPPGGAATVTVTPDNVSISPDPALTTKYGGGTGVNAPFADADDSYQISARFEIDSAPGTYIDGADYKVQISYTLTPGSNYFSDKISRSGPLSVFTQSVIGTYSAPYYTWDIKSLAPTSSMNGFDSDNDGVINYFYDEDPITGDLVGDLDFYEITGVDFNLIEQGGAPPALLSTPGPAMWGMGTTLDLDFTPAIEVANLQYVTDPAIPSYIPLLPAVADVELPLAGLVAKWTNEWTSSDATIAVSEQTFDIIGGSYVDSSPVDPDLYPVFDSNSSGTYEVSDSNFVASSHSVGIVKDSTYLSEYSAATTDWVEVLPSDYYWRLDQGSEDLSGMQIVDDPSSTPLTTSTISNPFMENLVSYWVTHPILGAPMYVHYRTNYLSRAFDGPLISINYKDPELKMDAVIIGSVTGVTATQTITSSDPIVLIGDVTSIQVRNKLFQGLSKLKKGATSTGGNKLTSNLEMPSVGAQGVSLLGGSVLYFTGDVWIQSVTPGYREKTIVVEGGNVRIDDDLDGDNAIGLVVFADLVTGDGGDVYIDNDVTELRKFNVYADGSVRSYDTVGGYPDTWASVEDRSDDMNTQLYWGGSVISKNTIGGHGETSPYLLPTGLDTTDELEAAEYDLNDLRTYQWCWQSVAEDPFQPGSGIPMDPLTLLPSETVVDYSVDAVSPNTIPCSDHVTSTIFSGDYPLHLEYIPPPSSLPLLGETQGGSFSVF
jgi:hypothetical protein